jgi:hypothetical protein
MRKFGSLLGAIFAGTLVFALNAAPAHAQATRTWVSGVGDDANPCSRTAPCKTFAGAISKTAAAGEINVLDPGGFGAVTITKSITIRSDSIEAGVLVAAGNGINVNAADTDVVMLYGLDFEGLGGGTHGVNIIKAGKVYVVKCNIHHFAQNGVQQATTTSGGRVFVKDSFIFQNAGGVNVQGTAAIGSILDTVIDSNTTFSLQVNGAGNVGSIARSVLNNAPAAVTLLNGGQAFSIGPSNVISGTGTFTPVAFQ